MHVPGFTHPVEEVYLHEVLQRTRFTLPPPKGWKADANAPKAAAPATEAVSARRPTPASTAAAAAKRSAVPAEDYQDEFVKPRRSDDDDDGGDDEGDGDDGAAGPSEAELAAIERDDEAYELDLDDDAAVAAVVAAGDKAAAAAATAYSTDLLGTIATLELTCVRAEPGPAGGGKISWRWRAILVVNAFVGMWQENDAQLRAHRRDGQAHLQSQGAGLDPHFPARPRRNQAVHLDSLGCRLDPAPPR